MTPIRHVQAVANDLDLRAGYKIESNDVMFMAQPRGHPAADQARRAGNQYPHVSPRQLSAR
jgi:hypothetical protein